MLKWIVILLKLVTVIPAIVSMKKAEDVVVLRANLRRSNNEVEACKAGFERVSLERNRLIADISELETLNIKLKADVHRLTEEVVSKGSEITQLKSVEANYGHCVENMRLWQTCACSGCKVLRASTHGYADRMRGAIRRDIEAESA